MPRPTFFNLPDEKRQKILEAAIDEFAERDYESASVSQIVIQAGIPKGSLYQYFVDKSDLHHYLLELALQKKAEMMASAQPPDARATLFERLRWLFEAMGQYEIVHPKLAKIGYRAIYGQSPLPESIITQAKESTAQYFFALIEQGKKNGEVRADIDARTAAFLFTAVLTQLGQYLITETAQETRGEPTHTVLQSSEARQIFDQLIAMLQYGMALENSSQLKEG